MEDKILKESAEAWLKYAIVEIRKEIKRLKVEDSGELYRSIQGHIRELSGGVSYKAELLYNYYGIFPDIGVGRAVKKDEVRLQKTLQGSRRPKPWTRVVARESHRFGDIMRDAYGKVASEAIVGGLKRKITMNF